MSRLLQRTFSWRPSPLNFRIGLLSLLVIGSIAILNSHAFFYPWLNLGNPISDPKSGEKAIRIVSANPRSIRVATNHSHTFQTDLKWIAWGKKPADFPWSWDEAPLQKEIYIPARFGCPHTFWIPPLIPALFLRVVDQIEVKGCRMNVGIEQAKFVLLEDGSIWVWESQKNAGRGD